MQRMWKRIAKKLKREQLVQMRRELSWMYQYVRQYRRYLVFYGIAGMAGTALGLAGSLASKFLIDAMTGEQFGRIPMAMTVILAVIVGSICTNALNSRISAKISVAVKNEIQKDMYDRILETEWEYIHDFQSGDLLNRLNGDVRIVSESVIGWIPSLAIRLLQFTGALGIILYYDEVMAGIALLMAPLTLLISRKLMKRMREHSREMQEITSCLMNFQNDSFQQLQTIKAFGLSRSFSLRLRKMQENYQEKVLDYNSYSIFTVSLLSLAGRAVFFACFGWGLYQYMNGNITMGTVMMFLQMAGMVSASFSSLMKLIPSGISAITSAGRLMEISGLKKEEALEKEAARELAEKKEEIQVVLDHAGFRYKEGNWVLKNGNFKAKTGEVVAVVGPSGEGKTTLIRLLLGLIHPTEGRAYLKGQDGTICSISASTREMFGYVPQGNTMLSGSIAENLRMVKPDATDQELMEALRVGCAWEFVRKLPEGIYSSIGEGGSGFSEGQAQRLAIARTFLRDAPVLLLDEATSALDLESEEQVLSNIMREKEKRVCIVATHRTSILARCDHVYEILENTLIKLR